VISTPRCPSRSEITNGQSGGALLALFGHVLEDVPALAPMSLTRLTVDIVRPVPVGKRLHVTTNVVREGKKIQVVELSLSTDDIVCTRGRALRIRDADLTSIGVPLPPSTTGYASPLPGINLRGWRPST